jgi:two-component system, NtrC family, nitrogen regulation sensor histidine kinase NtrY
MALQQRLLAYLVVIHLAFLGIVFSFYESNPILVVLLEGALILSLLLGVYLVRQVLQPLAFARQFQEPMQS